MGSEALSSAGEPSLTGPSGERVFPGGRGRHPFLLLVRMSLAEAGISIRSFSRGQEGEEGAEFRWSGDGEERPAAESSGESSHTCAMLHSLIVLYNN